MRNSNIILGITGGIAAYKSIELARQLVKNGHNVQVVMTEAATQFVTELTFQVVTKNPVRIKLFDNQAELGMGHIELARWADSIIVAPATANCIANLAHGMASDLLSTLCLAFYGQFSDANNKIYLAPAMNKHMWNNPLMQANINKLSQLAYYEIIPPESGEQACGDVGYGRMASVEAIVEKTGLDCRSAIKNLEVAKVLEESKTLAVVNPRLVNKKILITAGPTKEAIDPVRFISNHSSGKMGYSLANTANKLGYDVTLISGPVSVEIKTQLEPGIKVINITTADEMFAKVKTNIINQDVFIGVAAVSDYKCDKISSSKIKKNSDHLNLKLVKNPDIIKHVGVYKKDSMNKLVVVGFAAESDNLKLNAYDKLHAKNLDFIILNDITKKDIAFDSDDNEVSILFNDGKVMHIAKQSKLLLAEKIIQLINNLVIGETNESRCESIR